MNIIANICNLLTLSYRYLFLRNPFSNQKQEEIYINKIINKHGVKYNNYLLKIIPKGKYIYVQMKSRNCGYIFIRK